MKYRLSALGVALCLVLSLTASLPAAAVDESTALETIRVLGIMVGDGQGNLNLTSHVTRAQFVTMMTSASGYKDTVGSGYGVSLFKDVKKDHWASEYIKLAVEENWMVGYVDGTFRPDNNITVEEACTALLKLLGYDSASLAGSFPTAQLSKAAAIGLLDDMTASRGETLTRQDCVTLFYNLLVTQNSAGTIYGTTLGYTVTNGEVDYSTLVNADTKGPYVASTGGSLTLPFPSSSATVYYNGTRSSLSAVKQYDVYYYNSNLNTVWVYNNRVTGTLTGVSPSQTAPTSATVSGVSYSIGTSAATYKLSSQGGFSQGDLVSLLLGMNGEIVDVIAAQEGDSSYYGVVVSSEKAASSSATTASSNTSIQVTTQVACTDGTVRTFYHAGSALSAGRLVSVTLNSAGTTVKTMQTRTLSGSVDKNGTSLGKYSFASDVEILDTNGYGGYARVYPSRLAGVALDSDDVFYYTLDANGTIDRLVLNDVTGDTYSYAYVAKSNDTSSGTSTSATYQYIKDGETHSLNSSIVYGVKSGAVALLYEDGQLKNMRQLTAVDLTDLTDLTATSGNKTYQLGEKVQVLLLDSSSGREYYITTLGKINSSEYSLQGWYDQFGCSAGGRIRIIVATPK